MSRTQAEQASRSSMFMAAYAQGRTLARQLPKSRILQELATCWLDIAGETSEDEAEMLFGRIDGLSDGLIVLMPPGGAKPLFE